MTTVRYFLPEDGDTELHPNVFLARRPRQPNQPPSLGDIKKSFPLPGQYHFRFKSSLLPGAELHNPNGKSSSNTMSVWMDCLEDHRPVPTWRNTIVAKVTRVSMDEDDYDDDEEEDVAAPATYMNGNTHSHINTQTHTQTHAHAHAHAHTAAIPPPQPTTENLLNVFDHPPAAAASTPHPTHAHAHMNGNTNLFDMDHTAPVVTSTHTSSSTGSLLNMDMPSTTSSTSDPHSDFLGMTMGPTSTTTTTTIHPTPVAPSPQSHPTVPTTGQIPPSAPSLSTFGNQRNVKVGGVNGFDAFADKQGPFGNLNWS